MVETLGVDLKACVYLDDPEGNPKPAREMGMATIDRLNAAQAIAELEMTTSWRCSPLLAKNAVSEWESLTRPP